METDEQEFDRTLHHHKKVKVQKWWKEHDDVDAKKLRRQKHREEGTNFNKRNKVILSKGDKKRFYTKPVMSWNALVSTDTPPDYDQDAVIEQEVESDDDNDLTKFNRNNTNFDKFTRFDYAEFDESNIKEDEEEHNGFNNENEEDIECEENEEDNSEFEAWDMEEIESDVDMNEIADEALEDKQKKEEEETFDIFDKDGNCTLKLDMNENTFYRTEQDENKMWKHWKQLRIQFRKAQYAHSQWAIRKQENEQIDKMIADAPKQTHAKRSKKRRRNEYE
eukprot:37168_1